MPLRTLLGYEPRAVSSRQRQDYGGAFVSFTPTTTRKVMASKKQKYQAPMARVKKLPPIDEESGGTPYMSPRIRGRQEAIVRRLPRNMFNADDDDDDGDRFFSRRSPVKHRPVIPVQPMVREKAPSPIEEDLKKDIYHPVKPVYHAHHVTPKDVNHTMVDGLVADYLHYSRYGHVIPVYEGTSSSSCPCCTDRNKQNVRTLLGFPRDTRPSVDYPTKYDAKSTVKNSKDEKELDSEVSMYPNSMYSHLKRMKAKKREPTPEDIRRHKIAEQSRKGPWVNYQPLPYATNYLNPEFNRPTELNHLYDVESHNNNLYMKHKVLEADSNFDSAMSKLGSFNFDGRQTNFNY